VRDPIVSNVREGLPPCRSLARFDGRRASMIDTALCGEDHGFNTYSTKRCFVIAGRELRPKRVDPHGFLAYYFARPSLVVDLCTDDPAEAQAAFERGAEWVRTGVGP